jgi:hypothetical protein
MAAMLLSSLNQLAADWLLLFGGGGVISWKVGTWAP